ncbi:E3 ubiquitin-protein ligase TOM1-like [Pseudohyphozyma bogoriensis]|nr:E3 ubiquitin-protein ligase TOM1-like [Pseudohyphozyma bogoriensis]
MRDRFAPRVEEVVVKREEVVESVDGPVVVKTEERDVVMQDPGTPPPQEPATLAAVAPPPATAPIPKLASTSISTFTTVKAEPSPPPSLPAVPRSASFATSSTPSTPTTSTLPTGPASLPAVPSIPTGPKGWRPPTGPRSSLTPVVARELTEEEKKEQEDKRRLAAVQKYLPKGPVLKSLVGAEFDAEVIRIRTQRYTQLLPVHLEAALQVRTAQAALAMGKAERDVARERTLAAMQSDMGGAIGGSTGMSLSLSGGI